ncbi:MAG: bacillithiol biosynthesis cysteine-adding enzyme BshC [Flavobacteriales bacterium]|nr:bacillithiol biosynthesis cysteine-adding enzyme BshC [Flavobacteriales bacterium]
MSNGSVSVSRRVALDLAATHRFEPIVLDHLADDLFLKDFRTHPFDRQGLEAAAAARAFPEERRAVLFDALERQYLNSDPHPAVRANLDLLARPGTLTVTTGHQLCLFTGPLYVPFKILNAVRLARELSTVERPVVPVFWMATEDHDRAEIDHAWLNGHKVHWPGDTEGAVGHLYLHGMAAVLDAARAALGQGPHVQEVEDALRNCYRDGVTLAQATRDFVHHLFGRFGVVVIDGDDAALKAQFAPILQEELLNSITERTVRYANDKLSVRYHTQAHVRPINVFHLLEGKRERIVAEDSGYRALEGPSWPTPDTLMDEVVAHPERFSPNVLLRPVYQEFVLPNIAMVGGGGEIAYWLQLRWLFQAVQVPMPVLVLRTSALLLGARDAHRLLDLGLDLSDLFAPLDDLRSRVAKDTASFRTDLADERSRLNELFETLAQRVKDADPTLEASVRGEAQKAAKGLDHLEQKLIRAAKREQEQMLQRLDRIHAHAFPEGVLQERRENILPWLVRHGTPLLDHLLAGLDPLEKRFSVLVLDQ